jgi:hypothetical protein
MPGRKKSLSCSGRQFSFPYWTRRDGVSGEADRSLILGPVTSVKTGRECANDARQVGMMTRREAHVHCRERRNGIYRSAAM